MLDPQAWTTDTADIRREEAKRWESPASFFYSQGHALVLSAKYFRDSRLTRKARGGVALKHLHRLHLAIFGQLMASLEFLVKDFIASVIDAVSIYDDKLTKAEWLKVDTARILSMRSASTTPGSLLLHPTLGWQQSDEVNKRYKYLFGVEPILQKEFQTLEKLWVLRHSVAHNAGFVIAYDAARAGIPDLADQVAHIDEDFIGEAFDFLSEIAKRLAEAVGQKILFQWLSTRKSIGPNWNRDKNTYTTLKLLATYIASRAQDLPNITKGPYTKDFKKLK